MKKILYERNIKREIEFLKQKGWIINDECLAFKYLNMATPYALGIEENIIEWSVGFDFSLFVRMYELEVKIKELSFSTIKTIEIFLRRAIEGIVFDEFGEGGFIDFFSTFQSRNIKEYIKEEQKNKRELTISSVMDQFYFSQLRTAYEKLPRESRKAIVDYFSISEAQFIGWLKMILEMRNRCAHHRNLWFIRYENSKDYLDSGYRWEGGPISRPGDKYERFFYMILVLAYLGGRIDSQQKFKKRIKRVLSEIHGSHKVMSVMGMPRDWINHYILEEVIEDDDNEFNQG